MHSESFDQYMHFLKFYLFHSDFPWVLIILHTTTCSFHPTPDELHGVKYNLRCVFVTTSFLNVQVYICVIPLKLVWNVTRSILPGISIYKTLLPWLLYIMLCRSCQLTFHQHLVEEGWTGQGWSYIWKIQSRGSGRFSTAVYSQWGRWPATGEYSARRTGSNLETNAGSRLRTRRIPFTDFTG